MGLKVIDLYCGAGGFSEGFRQAGFEIKAGFDDWKDARTTFQKNFPEALVPDGRVDIPRNKRRIVNLVRKEIGHVDIIIGGPPCVEFSSSKNAGKGDVNKGLRHVKAFFYIVKKLEPDFWVMENVPRIERFLNESADRGMLNPPSGKDAWVFDSRYHSVPQARKRLFTGNIPGSSVTESEAESKRRGDIIPMRRIILGLPNCFRELRSGIVQDPLYPRLRISESNLTDHLGYGSSLSLTPWERMKNMDLKRNHPYCGRMRFPEDLDRPARTIMATQFSVSRESVIIRDPRRNQVLRLPTPRECASLQGFPLTFQFWGNSVGARYTLIGNAVPVGLARDIAKSILVEMDMEAPKRPMIRGIRNRSPDLRPRRRKPHVLQGPFRWHPSGSLINGCRVDLDNTLKYNPSGESSLISDGIRHLCRWDAVLHAGIGRPRWKYELVDSESVLESLRVSDLETEKKSLLLSSVKSLHGNVPDASTLLEAHKTPSVRTWRKSQNGVIRPRSILEMVDSMRGRVVRSKVRLVDCKKYIEICPDKGLPLVTLVTAFIMYWACREMNECTDWMIRNKDKGTLPDELKNARRFVKRRCGGVKSTNYPRSI